MMIAPLIPRFLIGLGVGGGSAAGVHYLTQRRQDAQDVTEGTDGTGDPYGYTDPYQRLTNVEPQVLGTIGGTGGGGGGGTGVQTGGGTTDPANIATPPPAAADPTSPPPAAPASFPAYLSPSGTLALASGHTVPQPGDTFKTGAAKNDPTVQRGSAPVGHGPIAHPGAPPFTYHPGFAIPGPPSASAKPPTGIVRPK